MHLLLGQLKCCGSGSVFFGLYDPDPDPDPDPDLDLDLEPDSIINLSHQSCYASYRVGAGLSSVTEPDPDPEPDLVLTSMSGSRLL